MKDRANEYHSPILTQAIPSSRKTSNPASSARDENTTRRTTANHLNHLINHFNHLNQIGLQDLSQRWQNNTGMFFKHHGKLEACPDSRAEVLQSSSVLFTSIQARVASILVDDVIDINCAVIDVKCPFNQNPAPPVPGSRFPESRSCFILPPKSLERTPFSLV